MDKIQFGYFYGIEYQKKEEVFFPNGNRDMEPLYAGRTKLTIPDCSHLCDIIPFKELEKDEFYTLNREQLYKLKRYMISPIEINTQRYEYFLYLGVEQWLFDRQRCDESNK